jgi:hypothetical protein
VRAGLGDARANGVERGPREREVTLGFEREPGEVRVAGRG